MTTKELTPRQIRERKRWAEEAEKDTGAMTRRNYLRKQAGWPLLKEKAHG